MKSSSLPAAQQQSDLLASLGAPPGFSEPAAASPMLQQYFALKQDYPDCLLFFRLGDFYEMFFEDARQAAAALDIALTKRGQHAGQDIPMCGVPAHSHESYLARLIRAGFRVAICEQMEDPALAKKRGGKAVVKRDVVRIITPGTLTEDGLLEPERATRLVALAPGDAGWGLAVADVSEQSFVLESVADDALLAALARWNPREILLPETQDALDLSGFAAARRALPARRFHPAAAHAALCRHYRVASLAGFGDFPAASVGAAGALLDYLQLTQRQQLTHLPPPRPAETATLRLDGATRRNLELTETLSGQRAGSLLHSIDRTRTAAGARRLAEWLEAPLTDRAAIEARLDAVQFWQDHLALAEKTAAALREAPDLARALARLSLQRGSPRDAAVVRQNLRQAEKILGGVRGISLPALIEGAVNALKGFAGLRDVLERALAAEPPALLRDGGAIAPGYDATLDAFRTLRDDSKRHIANLQARYAQQTGLGTLKVKFNNILGYFVELTAKEAEKLSTGPLAADFRHRQSLAGAMRFTTAELQTLERDINEAAANGAAREAELFAQLVNSILENMPALRGLADALAGLDVTSALAALAQEQGYVRPKLADDARLRIQGGRHPVVEASLRKAAARFMPNDLNTAPEQRLWLLTGPNMAGKSTFLRQNALMVLLAQMGSFVPAVAAEIGIVDRLFSRVGAADDLARGQSTFMVEMLETALILNQARARSLVILDEIGRGTATHDGMAIAQAVLEYLHNHVQCRGLFATHYHELTALTATLPHLYCARMEVAEHDGKIVFLHSVAPGAAQRSYGLHVARLAGLPNDVLARAGAILQQLEAHRPHGAVSSPAASAVTASSAPAAAPEPRTAKILAALAALDPDALTPKDALDALYQLKGLAVKD